MSLSFSCYHLDDLRLLLVSCLFAFEVCSLDGFFDYSWLGCFPSCDEKLFVTRDIVVVTSLSNFICSGSFLLCVPTMQPITRHKIKMSVH